MPLDQRARTIDFLGVIASFTTALTGLPATWGTPAPNTYGYVDTGGGRTVGDLTVDVSYASLASPSNAPNLSYKVYLQGSASSTFATPWVTLASMDLGPWQQEGAHAKCLAGILRPSTANRSLASVPVRATIPFTNDLGGTCYRYLRLWLKREVGATVVTGIIFKAWVGKRL